MALCAFNVVKPTVFHTSVRERSRVLDIGQKSNHSKPLNVLLFGEISYTSWVVGISSGLCNGRFNSEKYTIEV